MLYHIVRGTVPPGKEEEAVRWLKQLAEHSNKINPRATVEIVHRVGDPPNQLFWVGKLASMEDHEAGGEVFQADPQTQAMLQRGEEFFTDRTESFYEVL